MFGERSYLAFPTKAFAGKPPQGFMAWCCSCCCPRRRREVTKTASETDNELQQQIPHEDSNTSIGKVDQVPVVQIEHNSIGKVDQVPVVQIEHSTPDNEKRSVSEDILHEKITPIPKKKSISKTPEDGKRKWIDIPLFKRRRYSVDESLLLPEDNIKKNPRKTRTLDSLGRRSGRDVEIPVLKIYDAEGAEYSEEDDVSISEELPPVVLPPHSKSASPSPIVGAGSRKGPGSVSSGEWPPSPEEDIDRLVAIHQRSSLSSLGQRSDSLASVYSGAGEGRYGTVTVKGEVEFGLEYNYKAGALEIHVKQCRDLAPVDSKRNRSDPYVKVYLLPDKSKSGKRKTKVKKHTLNPVFDETLKFQMTLHGLETRTLWLTVWHSDMFGRNDFLGEVMMALENKVFDDPSPQWYPLQERTEPFDDLLSYKGDLIIGLKFVPPDASAVQKKGKRFSRGSLNVLIKEAKNLTAIKANGTSDPFCKSYLLPDKGRSSKQKTPVLRRTCSPVWNYTFLYDDVSLQELSERSLELTVWDHDRLASNEFLGGLRFSLGTGKHYGKAVDWMDATGKEVTLWQQMLERPNFWVEGCLTLRPSLEHRNSS